MPIVCQNNSLGIYLKQQVYDGESRTDIFELPLIFDVLALLAYLPFSIQKDIRSRKQMKNESHLKAPILVTPKQFNKAIGGTSIGLKVDQCSYLQRPTLITWESVRRSFVLGSRVPSNGNGKS